LGDVNTFALCALLVLVGGIIGWRLGRWWVEDEERRAEYEASPRRFKCNGCGRRWRNPTRCPRCWRRGVDSPLVDDGPHDTPAPPFEPSPERYPDPAPERPTGAPPEGHAFPPKDARPPGRHDGWPPSIIGTSIRFIQSGRPESENADYWREQAALAEAAAFGWRGRADQARAAEHVKFAATCSKIARDRDTRDSEKRA
jgi:hypothetical protein